MKVLFDHQIFSGQRYGGVSRYFCELIKHLSSEVQWKQTALLSDNEYLKEIDPKVCSILRNKKNKAKRLFTNWINKKNSIRHLNKSNFDVFHPTYYDPYYLDTEIDSPIVVTVHDLIHEKFPHLFTDIETAIDHKKTSIYNATRIVAVSENTKKDLIEIYKIDPDKINVVYLGQNINTHNIEKIHGLPSHYILFVGSRSGYKNFDNFLLAYSEIARKYSEIHLVCTGESFSKNEIEQMKTLSLQGKCHSFFVSDAQLAYIYKNALCFIYPSLYEGFGIPILESFANKCPVVLSKESCFPEVAEDGAIYFDPYSIDSMIDIISQVINDIALRKQLIVRGDKILSKYSWAKMSTQICNIYGESIEAYK